MAVQNETIDDIQSIEINFQPLDYSNDTDPLADLYKSQSDIGMLHTELAINEEPTYDRWNPAPSGEIVIQHPDNEELTSAGVYFMKDGEVSINNQGNYEQNRDASFHSGIVGNDEDNRIDGFDLFRTNTGLEWFPDWVETGVDDQIAGGKGNDTIYGHGGNDSLWGEDGDDQIHGGAGNDYMIGGDGDDRMFGGDGNDFIEGGEGQDLVEGGKGNDNLQGNAGDDTIMGGSGDDMLSGGDGSDQLFGGDGNDQIDGGSGHDILWGEGGRDTIKGGGGDDQIRGGDGDDQLYGQAGNDTINGDAGNDNIQGGDGDDMLFGGAGDDNIRGGSGDDTMSGGDGADIFIFNESSGKNVITDFESGVDEIIIWNKNENKFDITVEEDGLLLQGPNDFEIFLEGVQSYNSDDFSWM